MPLITVPLTNRRRFLQMTAWSAASIVTGRAAATSVHWALLSDPHIAADPLNEHRGFRPAENLKKVVGEVVQVKPETIVVNGDLARLEGLPADYQAYKTAIAPLSESAPVCMTLGNHDHRKNFLGTFSQAHKGLQPITEKYVLVLEQAPIRAILLDSLLATNLTPGLLGKAQRTWLGEYLASSSNTPTLIFVHHTMDDRDGSLLDTDHLFSIVRPHRKVKAIIYGHSHVYRYDTMDGIHMVNLPAIGYNFADTEPVGWVDAHFTAQGGDFKLNAIGGNTELHGKKTSLRWRT
jgi:Icc protein